MRWNKGDMLTMSTPDRASIMRVCERHGVVRLSIFGSALADDSDPEYSEIDLIDPRNVRSSPYFAA